MYLHEDRELFQEVITNTAVRMDLAIAVVEKDYYVTMILKLLSDKADKCVFKGGTSLSKGFHVLNRFSEDIDITFSEHLGEARPTEKVKIDNYVRQYLVIDNKDLINEFGLELFEMNLQTIGRTYIDKVFALCDYYIQGKSKRYSRHLYDLYKLKEHVAFDENFVRLVKEIRNHRAKMKICPSAKEGVDIPALIHEFCEKEFYRQDYISITEYFVDDMVGYEQAAEQMVCLADSGMFE